MPLRLYFEARYFDIATGELEKVTAVSEAWAQTYPRDDAAARQTALNYFALGQHEKCVTASRLSTQLSPGEYYQSERTMVCLIALGRFAEARGVYEKELPHSVNGNAHLMRYWVAFLERDNAEMNRQVSWAANSDSKNDFLQAQAKTDANSGKIGPARELNRLAADGAIRNDDRPLASNTQIEMASAEAEVGNQLTAIKPDLRREQWMNKPILTVCPHRQRTRSPVKRAS